MKRRGNKHHRYVGVFGTIAGPIAVSAVLVAIYFALKAIALIFNKINTFVTADFLPWLKQWWWAVAFIWAFIFVSNLLYTRRRVKKITRKEARVEEEEDCEEDEEDDDDSDDSDDSDEQNNIREMRQRRPDKLFTMNG